MNTHIYTYIIIYIQIHGVSTYKYLETIYSGLSFEIPSQTNLNDLKSTCPQSKKNRRYSDPNRSARQILLLTQADLMHESNIYNKDLHSL